MKIVALLLLVFAFLGNATAAQVPGFDDCCPDNSCHLVDCVSMGCLPVGAVALPTSPVQSVPVRAALDWLIVSPTEFESHIEQIWAPPD